MDSTPDIPYRESIRLPFQMDPRQPLAGMIEGLGQTEARMATPGEEDWDHFLLLYVARRYSI